MEEQNITTTNTDNTQEEQVQDTNSKDVKQFTQADLDRQISLAFEKWSAKQKRAQERESKLQGLSDEQRHMAELEEKVKEYEEQLKVSQHDRNMASATKVMADRGLPTMFAEYMIKDTESDQDVFNKIIEFEKVWKSAINDTVSKRIGGDSPKASNKSQTGMTKEQFKELSLFEKNKLFNSNAELYKQLSR